METTKISDANFWTFVVHAIKSITSHYQNVHAYTLFEAYIVRTCNFNILPSITYVLRGVEPEALRCASRKGESAHLLLVFVTVLGHSLRTPRRILLIAYYGTQTTQK